MPRWPWSRTRRREDNSSEAVAERIEKLIETVDLLPNEKEWLKTRWLGRVKRMSHASSQTKTLYYYIRGGAIASSLIVPALVGLDLRGSAEAWIGPLTIVLSLVAAIGLAILELLRFGPRWHLYRQFRGRLESEGWRFLELTEPYNKGTHKVSFPAFVNEVEDMLMRYEREYVTEIVLGGRVEEKQVVDTTREALPEVRPALIGVEEKSDEGILGAEDKHGE